MDNLLACLLKSLHVAWEKLAGVTVCVHHRYSCQTVCNGTVLLYLQHSLVSFPAQADERMLQTDRSILNGALMLLCYCLRPWSLWADAFCIPACSVWYWFKWLLHLCSLWVACMVSRTSTGAWCTYLWLHLVLWLCMIHYLEVCFQLSLDIKSCLVVSWTWYVYITLVSSVHSLWLVCVGRSYCPCFWYVILWSG